MRALFKTSAALAAIAMAVPAISGGDDHANSEAPSAEEQAKQAAAMGEAMRAAELWIEGQRQFRKIPGLSVAVAQGDRTVWAKGFGHSDRAMSRAATPDTLYSICSISKLFTSVALMQQWEADKVRLDAPVTDYLPWAQLQPDDRESVPVTLRGLLTHSAGLPRESDHPYWTGPDFPFPTQAQIRERISGQSPLYPASTTFQYSNLGLTLVGETVEAVSGQPFGDYVTAEILEPLGLDDTRPGMPRDLYDGQLAVGWGALKPDGTRPAVKLFDPAGITPAAGFSSSVNDLARFASWMFRLAKSGEEEVLRASTLREMQRVHYITPDWETTWGLGFAVRNQDGMTTVGHGGSCPGYRSSLMTVPEQEVGIAVAMNAMDNPSDFAMGIGGLMKSRMDAKDFDAPEGEDMSLADYTGFYDSQPWSTGFYLVPWAGGLTWLSPNADEPGARMWRAKPLGGDRFQIITDKGQEREIVTFERNASGEVVALVRHGNRSPRVRGL
ncbi:serine hydrolase domain-containing protein [Qipengyuania vesicularis]|uniref:serine hydrolase domain-containing protein n=1 Tax=Qipengyuania vesicularis TaxID=2867232 RepID=UPI001C8767A6|nr:serine hydrolase domain-containing protein [Qipengyuania vesicularis]MBX7528087.1 beta-lactamase family protein [Qipengyuania vesicularis]